MGAGFTFLFYVCIFKRDSTLKNIAGVFTANHDATWAQTEEKTLKYRVFSEWDLNRHPYPAQRNGFSHRGGFCPTKRRWLQINEDSQQTGLGVRSWDNLRSFLIPDGRRLLGYVSS